MSDWVLVPREPTEEMIDAAVVPDAAFEREWTGRNGRRSFGDSVYAQYRSMLGAAPRPSPEAVADVTDAMVERGVAAIELRTSGPGTLPPWGVVVRFILTAALQQGDKK